jgi:TetR/AcrR family transcriptional repressor of nem operon
MARHREFDETEVLDAAMHSFWLRGYEGTSLQDLETATGLTRTSIYNAFGNKRKLFERIVRHYQETVLLQLLAQLDQADSLTEGIRKLLNNVIELHFDPGTPGGCLVLLSLMEREQHDAHSVEMLEKIFQGLDKNLRKRISSAQKQGEIDSSLDPNALAGSVTATMAGLMVMGKSGFSKAALKKTANNTSRLFTAAAKAA